MTEFAPELLDDADKLLAADRGGLLRALASAGAQVRRAVATIDEFGIERLREDEPPRAVLVAPDPHSAYLSSLLGMLGRHQAPVVDWRDPTLPRWAGPADALLVISTDGRHPRLAELVDQADRRGLALAVVAPAGSPVAVAGSRHPTADVSHLASMPNRAIWWGLAVPALQALDSFGLTHNAPILNGLADALDEVAEANRPDSPSFTGPAKGLAIDLAEAVPVIAGAGSGATVAARRVAGSVQLIGGWTAMAASLPDDVARVGSLLEFSGDPAGEGFFADREFAGSVPRLVLIGADDVSDEPGAVAARRAALALAELASSRGVGSSRIELPDAPDLIRFGVAAAIGDFAATYLALARGIDPSAPRLGELAL
jgi:glucose/mannose-6-phosphate isomerase